MGYKGVYIARTHFYDVFITQVLQVLYINASVFIFHHKLIPLFITNIECRNAVDLEMLIVYVNHNVCFCIFVNFCAF